MRLEQLTIDNLQLTIPELPEQKRKRFVLDYNLPKDFTEILVSDRERASYFESAVKLGQKENLSPKMVADLMVNRKMDLEYSEPAGLVRKILELTSVEYATQSATEIAIIEVIAENQKAVDDYKNGKGEVVGFLIGMVQKKLKGKGNPKTVRERLLESLQK
jgi:aspartyl-tRNA(Asn)/glutamyl-tRNA(Gln) amidotransferase subunit B